VHTSLPLSDPFVTGGPVKQLRKRFVPAVTVIVLGVAALLLTASPASADRVPTSVEARSTIVTCVSPCSGTPLGTAQPGSLARSYCLTGSFALIYSQGADRFGYIPRSALVNETQNANCFSGGTLGRVRADADMRSCAGSSCGTVVGDAAPSDTLKMYCQRFDASFVRWMATFNQNGPQTGFIRSSAFDAIPPTLSDC
jgi:hypothetical protein